MSKLMLDEKQVAALRELFEHPHMVSEPCHLCGETALRALGEAVRHRFYCPLYVLNRALEAHDGSNDV
jgi:hypothetical protein